MVKLKSFTFISKSTMQFLIVTVLTVLSSTLPTSSAVQCRSFGRQLGECVEITRCPRLLAILLSSNRTIQDLRMLQKLTCVTQISDLEKDPVVCCPLNEISDALINTPSNNKGGNEEAYQNENPNFSIRTTSTPTRSTTARPPTTTTSQPETTLSPFLKEKFKLLPSLSECSIHFGSDRIIGGTSVDHGTYPWMARLGYKNKGTGKLEYYCGGSIINSRYILTAGHCTQGFDENFYLAEVRLGEHDSTKLEDCSAELGNICTIPEDFKIEKVITHPQHNTATKHNDIALIRLSQNVAFKSYFVRPVCLPFYKEYEFPAPKAGEEQDAIVAGWGRQLWNKTQGSSLLQHVKIPIVSNAKCQQLYKRRVQITSKQMCAGGVIGRDSCAGDSGGPLMVHVTVPEQFSKPVQLGVVSFGQVQCGGQLPGVYTRVSEYLPWILSQLEP